MPRPKKTPVNIWANKDLNVPNLDNILSAGDKKEITAQRKVTEEKSFVPYSDVWQKQKNNSWKKIGFKCHGCDKVIKSPNIIINHKNVCKRINTLYTEIELNIDKETYMPIQVITVKGEKMYRWGDHGKLYRNRADAEKQAQAAYASGYKEPKQQMKDKNK